MILPPKDYRSSQGHWITCTFCGGEGCDFCASRITQEAMIREAMIDAEKCVREFEDTYGADNVWDSMPHEGRALVIHCIKHGRRPDPLPIPEPDHYDRFRNLEYRI